MQDQDDVPAMSLAESAEILRLVLPKMREHADGYLPVSYALWFEYMRGAIPQLRATLDARVAVGGRLTNDETRTLFDEFVRGRSDRAFATARARFAEMLAELRSSIERAQSSGEAFDVVLTRLVDALDEPNSVEHMAEIVPDVASGTARIRETMAALSGELAGNKAEVDRLNAELNRLREDVVTDPLTGLANRRGLDAAIERLGIARGDAGAYSIAMLDIDHFKKINDAHGHLAGDRVLQRIASTMKSCVRGADICARYGGEEFALLLPETAPMGAKTVVDHIRNALMRAQISAGKPGAWVGPVTMSAGIAACRDGESVEDCIRRADEALYASKRDGRNRVTVAS